MKLFLVITESEDRSPDAPKGSIMRTESWFAAPSMEQVWEDISLDRKDAAVNVVGIIEQAPSVRVLLDI